MKISRIKEYTRESLKQKKTKSFFISLYIIGIVLFFKLIEVAFASFMLYFTDLEPVELFYNNNIMWIAFSFICNILRYIAEAMAIPVTVFYFSSICGESFGLKNKRLSEVALDFKIWKKNLSMILLVKLLSIIVLIPVVFFGITTVKLFLKSYTDLSPNSFFLSFHALVMTIVSIFVWLWFLIGLISVPFIVMKNRNISNFKIILLSLKLMKGKRFEVIRLCLYYLLIMLIPFAFIWKLPEMIMSISIYINICLKEAEYIAENCVYSENKYSNNRSKLFNKKKSIEATFD